MDNVLKQHFSNVLSAIIAGQVHANINNGIAVAYSGGLDSSILLRLTIDFASERNLPVFAFHVHHGLSPNADIWLNHCRLYCEQANIDFSAIKVNVDNIEKLGVEAAAREQRYRALGKLCSEKKLSLILTGHHQDDQVETILLQLLRGSGLAGLSGMDSYNYAPTLLGNDDLLLARPLLRQSKQVLVDYAENNNIEFVNDESNFDSRFARNALRLQVMPALSQISSNYADRIVRSAQHAQSANRLLIELAQLDFEKISENGELEISLMRDLSHERIENVLRFWLSTLNVRMPSVARLTEMRTQLFDARDDAKITLYHDGIEIHRYKYRIIAEPKHSLDINLVSTVEFTWSGQSSLHFPQFCGSLHFETSCYGVDASWLQRQNLSLRSRHGGERLRLAANRPTRDIKSHFQSLKIPFWQRPRLPILCVDDKLLHASLVGTEASFCQEGEAELINFRWQAEV